MQNNKKTVDMATARLLGYRVSSVDWLKPFDERTLVSSAKCHLSSVQFISFALYVSSC